MTKRILTLPARLRRSITWDQGKEMAEHARFTVEAGVQIYFCDPKSPGAGAREKQPGGTGGRANVVDYPGEVRTTTSTGCARPRTATRSARPPGCSASISG
jgi:hypothetical protein